ncbi:hypothetical protein QC764_0081130 [Podospora pseudoanserina]|uniref:Uncharacterized protein n=1 Tax=Podospora pseudoanserina TaxID=2609844 RepID=A0ABR0I6E6_9PEZI|nr:hypothetical protein QC764_0081130 [Podospora pseudoanserina]
MSSGLSSPQAPMRFPTRVLTSCQLQGQHLCYRYASKQQERRRLAQIALAVQSRQDTDPFKTQIAVRQRETEASNPRQRYSRCRRLLHPFKPTSSGYIILSTPALPNVPPRQQPNPLRQPSEAIAVTYQNLPDGTLVPITTPYYSGPHQDQAKKPPTTPPPHDSTDVGVPEATRLQTYHRTTYQVKSSSTGGKIKVSAPVGNNKAQLFDAIAAAKSITSGSGMRSSKDDSRLVRHRTGGEKKKIGGLVLVGMVGSHAERREITSR